MRLMKHSSSEDRLVQGLAHLNAVGPAEQSKAKGSGLRENVWIMPLCRSTEAEKKDVCDHKADDGSLELMISLAQHEIWLTMQSNTSDVSVFSASLSHRVCINCVIVCHYEDTDAGEG